MQEEYDFSTAVRGKFTIPNAELIPPVRLEPAILEYLLARAQARGTSLDELVNRLLQKDIELIEAAN